MAENTKIVVEYKNRAMSSVTVSSYDHINQYSMTFGPMPISVAVHDSQRAYHRYPSLRDAYNHAGYYERESLHELLAVLPQLAYENGFVYDFNVRAWVQGNPAPNVISV
jgi:hypothetical protein